MSEENSQNIYERFNIDARRVQAFAESLQGLLKEDKNNKLTTGEFVLACSIISGELIGTNEGAMSEKIIAGVQSMEIFEEGIRAGIAAALMTNKEAPNDG